MDTIFLPLPPPSVHCLLFAASGCRFYCRFSLPLLVTVLQGKIIASIMSIEELKDYGIEGINSLIPDDSPEFGLYLQGMTPVVRSLKTE
jgi:hypothetical protein